MKVLIGIVRIVVGILFIISGFIKLNDPVGFSYKLQEYFSPGVLDLEFLSPFALGIAILLVITEVILGIALIIGYMRRLTLALLLIMILFFTFLTFYSAYFNKVTDCGCFGDALPLTPWQSFTKDVILLVLILILIVGKKYLIPFFTSFGRAIIIFLSFIACLGYGYYVLMHLPAIDFRAYKEGVNILEDMQVPDDAPKAVFEYQWKFNIDGQEKIITTSGSYPDVEGEFIEVETKQIKEGYVAPIHDFTIEKEGEDYAEEILNTPNLIVVIAYDLAKTEWNGWPQITQFTDEATKKGYRVIGLTASDDTAIKNLRDKQNVDFEFYFTDETTLKTIVRSNPGVLKLEQGTIIQKRHWNDVDEITLKNLPEAKPQLNLSLKRKLDSIARLDNLYRPLLQELDPEKRQALGKKLGLAPEDYNGDLYKRQRMIDTSNLRLVKSVLDRGVYPGKNVVGEPTNLVAITVIKHNPEQIAQYLDLFKAAGKAKQIPFTVVAELEDRYLMGQGKEQIYGTQAQLTAANGIFIWPIENADQVNTRRKEAGFKRTIEEYAKDLIGNDYVYRPIALKDVKRL